MVVDALDLEFAAAAQVLNVRGGVEEFDTSGYAWVVIDLLNKLVPSDAIAWFSIDGSRNSARMVGFPGELPDDAACQMLLELGDDHPMLVSYLAEPRNGGLPAPRRLSDLVTDRQLRRTRTFTTLLHPVDRIRQLTVVSTVGEQGKWISWTLNRRRLDFTDEGPDTLRHLQPTLALLDRAYSAPSEKSSVLLSVARFELSEREIQVLRHVQQGMTAKSIAHLLGVSPRTISKHLEHIYRKLGCNDRVTAVELLRRNRVSVP